jgi:rhamnogalacturonyl hydrolase YesR
LIDALQDYSFRMAVTGRLTRDPSCYRKAVEQFTLYHDLVRYPETGLYSQGRGWLDDPEALSPGAWSRGHGWLIRGMVDTLIVLPPKSDAAATLKGHLAELAAALLAVQQPSGLWPCLLDRAPDLSPPEVSGTALIAGNLAIAVAGGWLPADPYARSARRAFSALPAFVEPGGTVRSVSPGPGPLSETGPWSVKAFPPGDEHGPFAILFAALGEWELSQSGFSADP